MDSPESFTDQSASHKISKQTDTKYLFSASLDKSLFLIVAIILLFTVVLLSVNLAFQHQNYQAGIVRALKADNIDHAAILTYTRAWDFAVAKISSMFLAFCLILIGALYVLRSATVAYSLSVASSVQKSSLETGSPGLVMITLGIVLMTVVILSTSKVEYQSPSISPTLSGSTIPPDRATTPNEQEPKVSDKPKK